MNYVLLTDNNDGVVLVACHDLETAGEIAMTAVWGDGRVSAWLIPTHAVTDTDTVLRILETGGDTSDVTHNSGGRLALTIEAVS